MKIVNIKKNTALGIIASLIFFIIFFTININSDKTTKITKIDQNTVNKIEKNKIKEKIETPEFKTQVSKDRDLDITYSDIKTENDKSNNNPNEEQIITSEEIPKNTLQQDDYAYLESENKSPATKTNINDISKDEYFNQIDQKSLTNEGIASGYIINDPNQSTTTVTSENESALVTDETAPEINQQEIIENSRLMGYVITEPETETPPVLENNSSIPATGDDADQINL